MLEQADFTIFIRGQYGHKWILHLKALLEAPQSLPLPCPCTLRKSPAARRLQPSVQSSFVSFETFLNPVVQADSVLRCIAFLDVLRLAASP